MEGWGSMPQQPNAYSHQQMAPPAPYGVSTCSDSQMAAPHMGANSAHQMAAGSSGGGGLSFASELMQALDKNMSRKEGSGSGYSRQVTDAQAEKSRDALDGQLSFAGELIKQIGQTVEETAAKSVGEEAESHTPDWFAFTKQPVFNNAKEYVENFKQRPDSWSSQSSGPSVFPGQDVSSLPPKKKPRTDFLEDSEPASSKEADEKSEEESASESEEYEESESDTPDDEKDEDWSFKPSARTPGRTPSKRGRKPKGVSGGRGGKHGRGRGRKAEEPESMAMYNKQLQYIYHSMMGKENVSNMMKEIPGMGAPFNARNNARPSLPIMADMPDTVAVKEEKDEDSGDRQEAAADIAAKESMLVNLYKSMFGSLSPPADAQDDQENEGSAKIEESNRDAEDEEDSVISEQQTEDSEVSGLPAMSALPAAMPGMPGVQFPPGVGPPIPLALPQVGSSGVPFRCIVCGEVFPDFSALMVHTMVHAAEHPHRCFVCLKVFPRSSSLNKHLRIHTGERPFPCPYCEKAFADSGTLTRHRRIHTGEKPFNCTLCPKTFRQKSDLALHMRQHTGEKPYPCLVCEKRFTNAGDRRRHLRVHTGEKPYACNICQKVFAQSSALVVHMKSHTGEKPYACDMCGKCFAENGGLTRHKKSVHSTEPKVKPFKCTLCLKPFARNNHLQAHMRTHTGDKPFTCDVCTKGFGDACSLKRHQRIHTGERPFVCTICYKDFVQSCALSAHMKIHSGQKPHKCEFCDKCFTDPGTLKSHLKTHTGERPYLCTICNKTFARNTHLTQHTRIHTGEKPFSCYICKKAFTDQCTLKRHVRTHTGERPYICAMCGMGFARNSSLAKHMHSHSSGDINPAIRMDKFGLLQDVSSTKTLANRDLSPAFPSADAMDSTGENSDQGSTSKKSFPVSALGPPVFPGLEMESLNPELLLKAMGTVRAEMDGKAVSEDESEEASQSEEDGTRSIKEEPSSDEETYTQVKASDSSTSSNVKMEVKSEPDTSAADVGAHYENYLKKMRERYANEISEEEKEKQSSSSQFNLSKETTFQVKITGDSEASIAKSKATNGVME